KIEVKDASEYLEKIKVGRDGLLIKFGMNSGLLLPQVPEEQGWGIEEYLDGICMKAGLAPGTWKEAGVSLESFQAQIFEEKE
ncbi:MAG: AMMECR1 domain-containing protein, partial [bacterium]|nr:AMMECR1 domain-containing protein [bacterium]